MLFVQFVFEKKRIISVLSVFEKNKSVFSVSTVGNKKHSCSFGGVKEST